MTEQASAVETYVTYASRRSFYQFCVTRDGDPPSGGAVRHDVATRCGQIISRGIVWNAHDVVMSRICMKCATKDATIAPAPLVSSSETEPFPASAAPVTPISRPAEQVGTRMHELLEEYAAANVVARMRALLEEYVATGACINYRNGYSGCDHIAKQVEELEIDVTHPAYSEYAPDGEYGRCLHCRVRDLLRETAGPA